MKWEKSVEIRPSHNIVSSDFPKYCPQPWKFMGVSDSVPKLKTVDSGHDSKLITSGNIFRKGKEGPARIDWLLSYEYQRKWVEEREAWKKRMFPENLVADVDIVKRYVLTFKANYQPPKAAEKKLFKMKKFQNIKASMNNRRSPDDKAMAYLEKQKEEKKSPSPTNKTEQPKAS